MRIRKKKKETRVFRYFVWKYIFEVIFKTEFFFLVFFRAEIRKGKVSLTKRSIFGSKEGQVVFLDR